MSHTFEPVVERLVIATCVPPYSTKDTGLFGLHLSQKMQTSPSPALLLMNISGSKVLEPEVADSYQQLMQRDNVWVLRVGLWLPDRGFFAAQMGNIALDAGNPKRRICLSRGEVSAWLGELATPTERLAIDAYVERHAPDGG